MALPAEFTADNLILCEGPSDAAFFRALIAGRNLPAFDVVPVSDVPTMAGHAGPGGLSGFKNALDGIRIVPKVERLKDILLVADCDLNGIGNFNDLRAQIANTAAFGTPPTQHYVAPQVPLVRSTGNPGITIVLIPWLGEVGHLECLLVPAAMAASPEIALCLDGYTACTGVDAWAEVHHVAEMKLRCILSAANPGNPRMGVIKVWDERPDLIPVAHASFDRLANFLDGYR